LPTYTSVEDFEAYVEGWVTDDSDALERLLDRAERDIDSILGGYQDRDAVTGLKIDPTTIDAWKARALSRAVCAQAEYRFQMGEAFMVKAQYESVTGPDFSMTGQLPYIAPKVRLELEGVGLRRMTTTVGGRRNRPPWYSFVREDSSWDYDPPPIFRR
jgi:hypothetical protein